MNAIMTRTARLPYGRHLIDEEDIQAVVEVLRSDWLTTGPCIAAFEKAFAKKTGSLDAIAVSSGTAALHAAMFAVGVEPQDEVIVPAITFVASANAAVYQGAIPVFADVDPDTLLLDPADVERKITDRTKVIVAVDYAGQPCDYDALRSIADKHDLRLIADACHALGATYKGRPVGVLADLSTFSLHAIKPITTGEGGMITTNDVKLAERLRIFRNHGIMTDHWKRSQGGTFEYEMAELGYNYRITDFQCALGLSQLGKLDRWIAQRQEIAAHYNVAFMDCDALELLQVRDDRTCAWHLYVIRLRLDCLTVGRREIFDALRLENIGVNVHYIPVPWHPFYQKRGYEKGQWPVAEREYERILSLPIFPGMSNQDVDDVVAVMKKITKQYARKERIV